MADYTLFVCSFLAAATWGVDFLRSRNRSLDAIYVIPIITWCVHVAIFYGVLVLAPVEWAQANRLFLNDWSKALILHNIIVLMVRGLTVIKTRRLL